MDIDTSEELAEIVGLQQEAQSLARWLGRFIPREYTKVSLVAVSFPPQDTARRATSCAVLTLISEKDPDVPEYHVCYIYRGGNNPFPASGDGPHLGWLYQLWLDGETGQKLIEEVEKNARVRLGLTPPD